LFDVEILVFKKIKTDETPTVRQGTQGGGPMLEYDSNVRTTLAAERTVRLAASMTDAGERVSLRRRLGALLVRVGERLDSGEPEPAASAPLELRLPGTAVGRHDAGSASRRAAA
jgi:hypothetical protein